MALEFLVRNQRLKLFSGGPVVADSQQYLKARFTFSEDWQGTRKYAQFRRNGEVYTCNIDDKGEVEVPWETLVGQGVVQISAFATNQEDETNKLITTNPVYIKVNTSGIKETELPKAPSLGILGDYVDQSLQEITDHKNQVLVYIEQLHTDVMEAKEHIDQTDYKIYVGETAPTEDITNAMVWINPAEDDNGSDELAEAVTAAQNAANKAENAVATLPDNWQDIVYKTDGFVTPEMYQGANDTERLKKALENENHYPVICSKGNYEVDILSLPDNAILDFNNATIKFSQDGAIECVGTLVGETTTFGDYSKGQRYITCTDVPNSVKLGDIVYYASNDIFEEESITFHYSQCGLVSRIDNNNIYISPAPVMGFSSGATVRFYRPKKCIVKNVRNIIAPDSLNTIVRLEYNVCSVIENVNFDSSIRVGIQPRYSFNIKISNCRLKTDADNSTEVYPLALAGCTNCSIENCNVLSTWHGYTSLGTVINYENTIKNCTFYGGLVDVRVHPMDVRSRFISCSAGSYDVYNGAIIENCNIDGAVDDNNRKCYIIPRGSKNNKDLCRYSINNCYFNSTNIWFLSSASEQASEVVENVSINNCAGEIFCDMSYVLSTVNRFEIHSTDFKFLNSGIGKPGVINNLLFANCILKPQTLKLTGQTTKLKNVSIYNCVFEGTQEIDIVATISIVNCIGTGRLDIGGNINTKLNIFNFQHENCQVYNVKDMAISAFNTNAHFRKHAGLSGIGLINENNVKFGALCLCDGDNTIAYSLNSDGTLVPEVLTSV